MCDIFRFDKETKTITMKTHVNKSSIIRAMQELLEMYLLEKYDLMKPDDEKELENLFYRYKMYDKFSRIIKKGEEIAKEIKD